MRKILLAAMLALALWVPPLLGVENEKTITYYQYLCGLTIETRGGAPHDPAVTPSVLGAFEAVPYALNPAYDEQLNKDLGLMLQGQMKTKVGGVNNTPIYTNLGNYIFNYKKPFMAQSSFTCGRVQVDIRVSNREILAYHPNRRSKMHIILTNGPNKEDFFDFRADPLTYADCYVADDNSWLKISTSRASWHPKNDDQYVAGLAINHYFFNGKYVGTENSLAEYERRMMRVDASQEYGGEDLRVPNLNLLKEGLDPFENTGIDFSGYFIKLAPHQHKTGIFSPDHRSFRNAFSLMPVPHKGQQQKGRNSSEATHGRYES